MRCKQMVLLMWTVSLGTSGWSSNSKASWWSTPKNAPRKMAILGLSMPGGKDCNVKAPQNESNLVISGHDAILSSNDHRLCLQFTSIYQLKVHWMKGSMSELSTSGWVQWWVWMHQKRFPWIQKFHDDVALMILAKREVHAGQQKRLSSSRKG